MTHHQELRQKINEGLQSFIGKPNTDEIREEVKHMIMDYVLIYGMDLRFDVVRTPDQSIVSIQLLD